MLPLKLMGYNLKIHLRSFVRLLRESQLSPYWMIPILGVIFGFVAYQIIVIRGLEWGYCGLAIYAITYFYNYQQSNFYTQQTSFKIAYFLRLSNNLLIACPFFIALLLTHSFLPLLSFFLFTLLYALFNANLSLSFTTKFTPFAKYFFEYNYGFRSVWWLYMLLAFVALQGIRVQNFPLFLVAGLTINFFQLASSYSIFEEESFIRIFIFPPQKILFLKIKQVVFGQLLLFIPTLIGSFFFLSLHYLGQILLAMFLAFIVGIGFVLTKYAFYERALLMGVTNLLITLFVALSPAFLPLLLLCIFFYLRLYFKALNNIKSITR